VTVREAVEAALEVAPDDARSAPARAVAVMLADKLDGNPSSNEAAALAREIRQTLASILPPPEHGDRWAALLNDLGDAE
jgi:hypothetical protein